MTHLVRRAGAALAVALLAVTATGCSMDSEDAKNAVASGGEFTFHSPGGKTEIFYPADERQSIGAITGTSVMDSAKTINLSDYDGQIVVLNAWGQWCAPCRAEVDDLESIQQHLSEAKSGTVLGINVQDYQLDAVQDFIKDNGVTYPSIYDPPFKSAAALGGVPTSAIPTTIVLDRQHRPAAVFLRSITANEVITVVDDLIKEA